MFTPLILILSMAASAPQAVSPPSKTIVDAFMAALPPEPAKKRDAIAFISDEGAAALKAKNPGREGDIQEIVTKYNACQDGLAINLVRAAATRLDNDKLTRLTAFYRSADLNELGRLSIREASTLSPVEKADMDRILKSYPVEDFSAAMKAEIAAMRSEAFSKAWESCGASFNAQMELRKLNS